VPESLGLSGEHVSLAPQPPQGGAQACQEKNQPDPQPSFLKLRRALAVGGDDQYLSQE
jgi:hypothetical protein